MATANDAKLVLSWVCLRMRSASIHLDGRCKLLPLLDLIGPDDLDQVPDDLVGRGVGGGQDPGSHQRDPAIQGLVDVAYQSAIGRAWATRMSEAIASCRRL